MGDLTAIDICVLPDDSMRAKAEKVNERMLQSIPPPTGFSLDEHHTPHLTTFQCFVHTEELPKVFEAIGGLVEKIDLSKLTFTTEKISHIVEDQAKGLCIALILCKASPEQLDFQAKVVDAVRPFRGSGGTADAFVRTKAEPNIAQPGIDFCENCEQMFTGAKYFPHVTVGLAKLDDLAKIEAETLEPLTFGASGVAIYHIGNQGTAAKLLKSWEASPREAPTPALSGSSRT